MALRITLDIVLFFALLLLPVWMSMFVVLVLTFYFEKYIEALFAGLILDSLHGGPVATLLNFQFVFTAVSAIFLGGSFYLKDKLRFYA